MKTWIETKYETYYDFEEWVEDYKVCKEKYGWTIDGYLDYMIEQAEDEGDYALLVSIERNRSRIYDIMFDLTHPKDEVA